LTFSELAARDEADKQRMGLNEPGGQHDDMTSRLTPNERTVAIVARARGGSYADSVPRWWLESNWAAVANIARLMLDSKP
jgi:hypothetical protein